MTVGRRLWRGWQLGVKGVLNRAWAHARILDTAPVTGTIDGHCEIHVLTCADDWLDLLCTLKSFYRVSNRHYRLCIHDDGTLDNEALGALAIHFPAARIIPRAKADGEVADQLSGYPHLAQARQASAKMLKACDFQYYLQAPRMLILDSHVIFTTAPLALLQRIDDPRFDINAFNAGLVSDYNIDPPAARALLGVYLIPMINTGVALVQHGSLSIEWMEDFLMGAPAISAGPPVNLERTLIALCASKYGFELLPGEYACYEQRGLADRPCRHYARGQRHLFYREGIPALRRARVFRNIVVEL